jgi:Bacterial nucleoid DNA-binding protein
VANGESVKIKNVGTFSLRMTQPTARNPSKNEVVEVKDRKRLRFVASSSSVRTLNK